MPRPMGKTPYYGTRRDANEPEIVEALEAVGAKVMRLDDVDLLVYFRDKLYLLEVKTAKGKLNAKQQAFFREWANMVWIVRTPEQALALIGAIEPCNR